MESGITGDHANKRPVAFRETGILVQVSSEIPLPSPSLYSLSCLGTAALDMGLLKPGGALANHCFVRKVWFVHMTLELHSNQKPQDIDQLGSLAGAARLLQDNAGVLKQCSDGTEISHGGEGQRCC